MYEKAIWTPKPSEPPKTMLGEGYVIRSRDMFFIVVRCTRGSIGPRGLDGLRLFQIDTDGRPQEYNRFNDLPAMDTNEYKTCTAIWKSVDDFVADMERS